MPRAFNVNTKEVVKFSKKLDLISKRSLPRVVKNTLNTMAFDTKKRTLIEESEKAFTNRNKTFFKRFSRVQPVKTNKIQTMRAVVGMTDSSRSGQSEQAGANMKQQQLGGKIKGRTLIPLDTARVANDNKRNVRRVNRIRNLNTVLDTSITKGSKHRQRFIRTAVFAVQRHGTSAVIQHQAQNGKTYLYRISRGGNDIQTRQFNLKVTPLYSVKKGRSVNINSPTRFTLRAAKRSQKRGNQIFIKNAKRQIARIR